MRKKNCPLLLIPLICFCARLGVCQDFGHSMAGFIPSSKNPVFTSAPHFINIQLAYKSQNYFSDLSIKTTSISVQNSFLLKDSAKSWGNIGLIFKDNRSDLNNYLITQDIVLPVNYQFPIRKTLSMTVGIQSGFKRFKIDNTKFTTGSQYQYNSGFNPALPTGENNFSEINSFFYMGAGLRLRLINQLSDEKVFLEASMSRINKPRESFLGNQYTLSPDFFSKGGITFYYPRNISIQTLISYQIENSIPLFSTGVICSFQFTNSNPFDPLESGDFRISGFYESSDTWEMGLTFSQPNYDFGFTYTAATSYQNSYLRRPAFSIGLRFRIQKKSYKGKIIIESESVREIRNFISINETDTMPRSQLPNKGVSISKNTLVKFELKKEFLFEISSAELSEEATIFLDEITDLMFESPGLHLKAIGHTDNSGRRKTNDAISRKRAENVILYLINKGIDPTRLKFSGKGDIDPVFPNDSEENRSRNRRVEILIYYINNSEQ